LPKLPKNRKYFVCKLLITHIWRGNERHMSRYVYLFLLCSILMLNFHLIDS
jgi:hypothetical protein